MKLKLINTLTSALLILSLVALLTGCTQQNGSEEEPAASVEIDPAEPVERQVVIRSLSFEPEDITVKKGDTITWQNLDKTDEYNETREYKLESDSFSSPVLKEAQIFSYTFNYKGTYKYYDSKHANLNGKVVVE